MANESIPSPLMFTALDAIAKTRDMRPATAPMTGAVDTAGPPTIATTNALPLSRLTTLWQAAGNDEGLKVKVIEEQDEVGKGKSGDAEGE